MRKVEKPWGHEIVFALSEKYCGKVIFVRAGEQLSLQFHRVKDETIYVHSGRIELELVDEQLRVGVVADGDEDPVHRQVRRLAGDGVLEPEAGHLVGDLAPRREDHDRHPLPLRADRPARMGRSRGLPVLAVAAWGLAVWRLLVPGLGVGAGLVVASVMGAPHRVPTPALRGGEGPAREAGPRWWAYIPAHTFLFTRGTLRELPNDAWLWRIEPSNVDHVRDKLKNAGLLIAYLHFRQPITRGAGNEQAYPGLDGWLFLTPSRKAWSLAGWTAPTAKSATSAVSAFATRTMNHWSSTGVHQRPSRSTEPLRATPCR